MHILPPKSSHCIIARNGKLLIFGSNHNIYSSKCGYIKSWIFFPYKLWKRSIVNGLARCPPPLSSNWFMNRSTFNPNVNSYIRWNTREFIKFQDSNPRYSLPAMNFYLNVLCLDRRRIHKLLKSLEIVFPFSLFSLQLLSLSLL